MPKHAVLVGVAGALVALLPATFGCGRPPTLLITAETLPAQSRSLAVSVTRSVLGGGEQATAEPLSTYDLPEPTPSRQSFLLRLPSGFSGSLNVSLAAFSGVGGAGCLQRLGFAAHEFAPQPYDDTLVLPLDLDPGDRGCESAPASLPRLIAASPAVVGTAGGLCGAYADVAHMDAVEPQPGQRAEYREAEDFKSRHVPILPVARCLRSGPGRRSA